MVFVFKIEGFIIYQKKLRRATPKNKEGPSKKAAGIFLTAAAATSG